MRHSHAIVLFAFDRIACQRNMVRRVAARISKKEREIEWEAQMYTSLVLKRNVHTVPMEEQYEQSDWRSHAMRVYDSAANRVKEVKEYEIWFYALNFGIPFSVAKVHCRGTGGQERTAQWPSNIHTSHTTHHDDDRMCLSLLLLYIHRPFL